MTVQAPVTETPASRLTVVPALGLFLAGTIFLLALNLRAPAPGTQVAVFYTPGTSVSEAIAGLGPVDATFVRPGRFGNIVIAAFDTPVGLVDLWSNGIWFAFDPLLLGGCLALPNDNSVFPERTSQ